MSYDGRFGYLEDFDAPAVFRYFDLEEHADCLMRGDVWISTLQTCRDHEGGSRGDPNEGTERYYGGAAIGSGSDPRIREIAKRQGIHLGPGSHGEIQMARNITQRKLVDAFVLCTTEFEMPGGIPGIGKYGVRISNPRDFFRAVTEALAERHPVMEAGIGRVHYGGTTYVQLQPRPAWIGFNKNPDGYKEQREVRMLWSVRGSSMGLKSFSLSCPAVMPLLERVDRSP